MSLDLRKTYWALRRLGERRSLVFFEAPSDGADAAQVPGGLVLGTAGPAAPPSGFPDEGDPAAARDVAERLRLGHRLLYVEDGAGAVLAWGWLTLAQGGAASVPFECGLRLGLGPVQAYFWDFTTLPQARRRGLYAALLRHGRALAAQAGVPRVAIYCRRENAASSAGIRAAGFEPSAALEIARAGPLRLLANGAGARRRVLGGHAVPLNWINGHSAGA